MKKFVVFCLAGLLIMSLSTMVYAQKLDFRASGFIYTQTFLYRNVPDMNYAQTGGSAIFTGASPDFTSGGGAIDKSIGWASLRSRLKFDAVMGKELSGTIQFEIDSDKWGNTSGDRNKAGYWTADRAALEIKHTYIEFAVPGIPVPATLRVGLQPAAVRPQMLLDTDGMGITGAIKLDPVTILGAWWKPWEGKDASADDVDYYAAEVNAVFGKVKVGAYGLYTNMNSYTVPTANPAYGSRSPYMAEMFWIGAYAEGKLGPVNFVLDFNYDDGEVEAKNVAGVKDADYSGWATRARVLWPVNKWVFEGAFRYGSGADLKETSASGLPGTAVAYPGAGVTRKVSSHVIPPGEGGKPDEAMCIFFGTTRTSAEPKFVTDERSTLNRGYTGGYWFGKLGFSYQFTPWYKAEFAGMYIGDTTKNGNTIGNARKSGTVPRDDDEIGVEFSWWNDFLIYKNLDFNVGVGYLFAGDGMEYWNSSKGKNEKPDDPWMFITRLRYRF